MRRLNAVTLVVMLLSGVLSAGAQGVSPEQNKLLSKRAAEADAYRKLAEAVYGLQINSTTYVRDFVTESDDIRTSVDAFIKGIRLGEPRWYEDLSCEVPAEVTVASVIETLRSSHERHYKGNSIRTEDFVSMTQRIEKKIIKVTGMGAPRPDLPPDLPIGVEEYLTPPPPELPPAPIPDIWRQVGPQARLMAIRAARVDAIRKLAERIRGLRLTSTTQVRDFVTESDEILTELNTVMATSGEEIRTYLHHNELIAEVTIRIPTEQVITTIKKLHSRHYKGGEVRGHDVENIVKTVVKRDFEATGMGVPPAQYVQRANQSATFPAPDWSLRPLQATGQGTDPEIETPQGRLKAVRAAELDAKRKLAEQVVGLQIRGTTYVRDFVTESDEVQTLVDAIIVGAVITRTEIADGVANVTVAVPGMELWAILHRQLIRSSR
ncbi:MAG: LPP20 family lipoprotein [Phycisphaerales bacterium]|nr:LPP20 family lipoprotein [Phycisphaerales bacterium]